MININSTLFMQMGAFLVLLFLLNIILYKPLLAKIRERFATIDELNEKARRYQEEAQKNEEEYKTKILEAEQTAKQNYASKIAAALKEKEEKIAEENRKAMDEIRKIEEQLNKNIEMELASSKDYSIDIANKIYKQLIG